MSERSRRDLLVDELKIVRRRGLHRLAQYLGDVPTLRALADQTTGADDAEHVENLLRSVYKTRSEGAQGTAIGISLGLEQGRRGANPTVLRQVAAERLGYHSTETYRKEPENDAIRTFADLIDSYATEFVTEDLPDDYRINVALAAIKNLSLTEYAELNRRLRDWFAQVDPGRSRR
ncbi:hypothetical protein R3Q15_02285 [Gordonia amicalis]|uniref:Uncharacterized protein n=1 Tax=Gordonia amicalis TaxID=89053 RepID=A0AAE4R306_9ACTN|nr:hypothetical protein [Gordonia amicalis]MDV6310738.1 hypothetical protein [Gordonia amicalis]